MNRRVWLVVIGVFVAAAVVVAAGATWRWHDLEVDAVAADDRRAADVVAGIVDSSLEELRERESDRPFDHYNAVYRPEGVIAASDALAPSPLSKAPDDERVLGWLQLNPDGTTTMPFSATRPEVAERLRAALDGAEWQALRATTKGPRAAAVAVLDDPGLEAGADRRAGSASSASSAAARAAAIAAANEKARAQVVADDVLLGEKIAGGVVQQLNVASTEVYSKLQEAEQQPQQRAALASNSKLPTVVRNDVDDGSDARTRTKSGKKPTKALSKTSFDIDSDHDDASIDKVMKSAPKPKPKPAPPKPKAATSATPSPSLQVEYTPMVFTSVDGQYVLHRTVSTGDGAVTVQAAVLDDDGTRRWLDGIVARRVPDTARVSLVGVLDVATRCTARAPVSALLDDVELCFSSTTPPPPWTELVVLGCLLALLLLVLVVLDRTASRAEALSRQRAAFISSVSHELRTPLTTLRMHAELLRDDLVDVAQRRRFLDEMVSESVRLSHLVENVLEAQRLEEGRRPLRLVDADVADIVADVCMAQQGLVAQRGFRIEPAIADDVVARGAVDRQAIEQIVVNLIENAVKYAGSADDRRIDVGVRLADSAAVIVVGDHGPGVPRHERERVFQRFARIERPGEEHIAGSGLGLALVRELAVAHGGSARIVDRFDGGGGCSVEVRIPLRTVGA